MSKVIVFDVNETLLDMSALDPHFERLFGSAGGRQAWFQQLKELWLVGLVTDQFTPFSELAGAALRMIAEMERISLTAEQGAAVVSALKELPPHAETEEALRLLREGGFALATLTNGGLSAARAQIEYAGLESYFDHAMSAEEVERHKPAREPYLMAAEQLGVAPGDIRMVAAHTWDIAGAAAAGCATAFVARPGKVMNAAGPAPGLQSNNLRDLAHQILGTDSPGR
ncbi:MAG: haloacid dehalogenase type II [Halofilum sp. (in: g-proteobacteria)]